MKVINSKATAAAQYEPSISHRDDSALFAHDNSDTYETVCPLKVQHQPLDTNTFIVYFLYTGLHNYKFSKQI